MSLITVPAVRVSAGWTMMEMIPFVSGAKNTEVLVRREGGREQSCHVAGQVCANNKGVRIYCNGPPGRRQEAGGRRQGAGGGVVTQPC